MLVFAGFVPNSPLLLPSINVDRWQEVEETRAAMERLAQELYVVHPETIVVFAESTTMYPDAFSLNVADPYQADLSALGDLGYQATYHPDFSLVDAVQREARRKNLPVSLSTDDRIPSSLVVPLSYLLAKLPKTRILPIAPCDLAAKDHFAFGNFIKHFITESHKRVAVIAAGDLSHALSKDAPAGFHKDGALFDEKMRDILAQKSSTALLKIDDDLRHNAHEAAYRQLCMLFGVLDGMHVTPKVLSYQAPFGVGLCVSEFTVT